jgi:hypothetical protein
VTSGSDFATLTVLVHGGDAGRQQTRLRLKSGEVEHKGAIALRARRGVWERYEASIRRDLKVKEGDSFDTIEIFNAAGDELAPWCLNYVLLQ